MRTDQTRPIQFTDEPRTCRTCQTETWHRHKMRRLRHEADCEQMAADTTEQATWDLRPSITLTCAHAESTTDPAWCAGSAVYCVLWLSPQPLANSRTGPSGYALIACARAVCPCRVAASREQAGPTASTMEAQRNE